MAAAHDLGSFERDVFRLINHLPAGLDSPLVVLMQAGALGAVPAFAAVALLARRKRLALDFALGGMLAWLLASVIKHLVGRGRPPALLADVVTRHSAATGLGFPSGHAAVAAALATAAGPYLPRRFRRATWIVVVIVAAARIYVGAHLPVDVIGGMALGWMVGAAVHLALGAPTGAITPAQVARGLAAVGLTPASVAPVGLDARGSEPFLATTAARQQLFVKAVGVEHRNADLLFKLWRRLALRHVEDEAPFTTPKQQVEHEALLLLLARRAGVRAPDTLAAVQIDSLPALLVLDHLDGEPLDQRAPNQITDELLAATWQQVQLLHVARIAHRDLRSANIVIGRDGKPWLVDFGFGELSASNHRLAQDVAELLTCLTLAAGPQRTINTAIDALGVEAVRAAVPLLQPMALSAATRRSLHQQRHVLPELRTLTAARTGGEIPELERLARVRPMAIVKLAFALFAVHLLLPQVDELNRTIDALGRAQAGWLLLTIVMSAGTYLAAAVALLGAVRLPLPFGRTAAVQLAGSFANRLTPASLGGIGISVRYLQRSGLARGEAITAATANVLTGALVHVSLLVAMGILAGRSQVRHVHLPSRWIVLVIVVAALTTAGLVAGTASGRRRILAPTRHSLRAVAAALRRPNGAIKLLGGSLAITAFYTAALLCALHAFGPSVAWTDVALVYLGGSAVAAASPTPGGVGAIEAALVAGLTGLGAAAGPTVAGVLAFRLATFWLPILPGWFAYHELSKRGAV